MRRRTSLGDYLMRGVVLVAAFVMACVVVIALFLLFTTSASGRMVIGVQDDGAMLDPALVGPAIDRAHSLHATVYRLIVREPHTLEAYDAPIDALCWSGLRVQVALTSYTSERFVAAAIRRWAPCVAIWSFWNEPDLTIGYRRYGWIQRKGFRLARRYDPTAKVLIGETSPHATLRGLRSLARRLPGDGLAIHPYQFSLAPWLDPTGRDHQWPTGVGALKRIVRGLHKPLYVTEFGYTPKLQSWWGMALRLMRRYRVRELVSYQLFDQGVGRWDTSLFAPNGEPRTGARHVTEAR